MNKFWSDRIRNITPYVPGEQPRQSGYIKLNTNENPYPPSPKVAAAIVAFDYSGLRLYPDPDCGSLNGAIAEKYHVDISQVFSSNGSDEILAFCFPAFFEGQRGVIFPDITYSFYPVFAGLFGVHFKTVPLLSDYSVPIDDFCKNEAGVIIANPNAPTGIALGLKDIERITDSNPDHVVLIDEAYVDFGAESAVGLIDKYENLLVVRTFSKSHGLAGLRVGYALGNRGLIAGLSVVRDSFNSYTVDRLAMTAAEAAIKNGAYYDGLSQRIINTRQAGALRFQKLGFEVLESKANFLFVRHREHEAKALYEGLKKQGILVRHFDKPRIREFLRVTVGTEEEMDILFNKLEKLEDAQ